MTYLAHIEVEITEYMSESVTETGYHLVEADSKEEATDLIEQYFRDKSEAYSVTYFVNWIYIPDVITNKGRW